LSVGKSFPPGLFLCETPAGGSFALLTLIASGKEGEKISCKKKNCLILSFLF